MGNEWPLRDHLELGAYPGAVPCARRHARQLLWQWGLAELNESVELLVSELVTNAVNVSGSTDPAALVGLWLLSDEARILVLVWDASAQPPIRTDADDEDEGGRGLLLVEALSDEWNWYFPRARSGKVVWAEVKMR